jgi:hypothetical protein
LVLSFTRGHNGDQKGQPAGPKMKALLPAYFYYTHFIISLVSHLLLDITKVKENASIVA